VLLPTLGSPTMPHSMVGALWGKRRMVAIPVERPGERLVHSARRSHGKEASER